jgi:hypothetical protein
MIDPGAYYAHPAHLKNGDIFMDMDVYMVHLVPGALRAQSTAARERDLCAWFPKQQARRFDQALLGGHFLHNGQVLAQKTGNKTCKPTQS